MHESLTREELGRLRHALRTPLNQIAGYAELLLLDPAVTERFQLQGALEQVLAASRDALAAIRAYLPLRVAHPGSAAFDKLAVALAQARDQVVTALAMVLRATPSLVDDELRLELERIRVAADELVRPLEMPDDVWRVGGASFGAVPAVTGLPSALPPSAAGGAVLVVDDTLENRRLLQLSLERYGYTVEAVASGEEALAAVSARPFDAVVLDVMMPGLDGPAVLERIKANPVTRDLAVVMASALDDTATIGRCLELGADDYITKPYTLDLLYARVRSCVERSRHRRADAERLHAMHLLTVAAVAIESGKYEVQELAPVAARDDELGVLARVLHNAVVEVRAREALAASRITALRADIRASGETAVLSDDDLAEFGILPAGVLVGGRFEIVRLIGRGGWATVYEADDRELGERVALKLLRPETATKAKDALDRLRAEIKLARRITHPNVVRIHDLGQADGLTFVTMELVEGVTVRRLIQARRQLGVASTLAIAGPLVSALEAAHRNGVIHRDIKPENIMLDASGVVKVMDFGIARLVETPSRMTQKGIAMGTPAYMAPEQLLEDPIDERTDLYAVGVVLFECLTGRLPHEAESNIALVAKILVEPCPDPADPVPEIPPALAAVVRSLLAQSRDERLANAARLAELLAPIR